MSLVDVADENIFRLRFDNDDGDDVDGNGGDNERKYWLQWHTNDVNLTQPVIYVS